MLRQASPLAGRTIHPQSSARQSFCFSRLLSLPYCPHHTSTHRSLHRYLCPAIDSTIMGRQWNWTGNRDRDAEYEFSVVLRARFIERQLRKLKILHEEKTRSAEIKIQLLQERIEVRNSIISFTNQKFELLLRQSELLFELTDVADRKYELEVLNLKMIKVQEEITKLENRDVHLQSHINSV